MRQLKNDVEQYRKSNENNYKEVVRQNEELEKRMLVFERKLKQLEDSKNQKEQLNQKYEDFHKDFQNFADQTSTNFENLTSVLNQLVKKVDNLSIKQQSGTTENPTPSTGDNADQTNTENVVNEAKETPQPSNSPKKKPQWQPFTKKT